MLHNTMILAFSELLSARIMCDIHAETLQRPKSTIHDLHSLMKQEPPEVCVRATRQYADRLVWFSCRCALARRSRPRLIITGDSSTIGA